MNHIEINNHFFSVNQPLQTNCSIDHAASSKIDKLAIKLIAHLSQLPLNTTNQEQLTQKIISSQNQYRNFKRENLEEIESSFSFILKTMAFALKNLEQKELENLKKVVKFKEVGYEEIIACAQIYKNSPRLYQEEIFNQLIKQDKTEKILNHFKKITQNYPSWEKLSFLEKVAIHLLKQGKGIQVLTNLKLIGKQKESYLTDDTHFKSISIRLAEQGEFNLALKVADQISEKHENKNSLFHQLSLKTANRDDLLEILEKIDETADCFKKNGLTVLKLISKELAQEEKFDLALKVTEKISPSSQNNEILLRISHALAKQGNTKKALEIAEKMDSGWQKDRALLSVFEMLVQQEKTQKALEVAEKIKEIDMKNDVFHIRAVLFLAQGNTQKALEMVENIQIVGSYACVKKSQALKEIGIELVKQGNTQEARVIANNIYDPAESGSVLKHIAIALIKEKKIEESLNLINEIVEDWQKEYAIEQLALELIAQKNIPMALKVTQEVKEPHKKDKILKNITAALNEQGNTQDSLEIVKKITSKFYKYLAVKDSVITCTKQNKLNQALSLTRLLTKEKNIDELHRNIALELAKQKNISLALKVIEKIKSSFEKDQVFKEIAINLINEGDKEQALVNIKMINNDFLKEFILKEILKKNWNQEALVISETMENDSKERAFQEIASYLINQGNFKQALEVINKIKDKNKKFEAIIAFAKKGKAKETFKLIEQLPDSSLLDHTNSTIQKAVETVTKQKGILKTLEMVNQMIKPEQKYNALSSLSKELFNLKFNLSGELVSVNENKS